MTKPLSDARRYINQNQALPPDCTLGYLTWYEVSKGAYDPAKLRHNFQRLGIPEKYMPRDINPADAWEKATKEVEGTKYAALWNGQDVVATLLVRDVERSATQIVRHLIREIKDAKNKRLAFDEVAQFVFYKAAIRGGQVQAGSHAERATISTHVSDSERSYIEAALATYRDAYARYSTHFDDQRIRAVIRDYLSDLNSTQLKPGVYFAFANREAELNALVDLVDTLDGCRLTLVPMPDLTRLRQDIIDQHEREAVEEATKIVQEIDTLRATRKGAPSDAQFARVLGLYQSGLAKHSEYTRFLHLSQEHTAAAFETAHAMLMQLQDEVVAAAAAKAAGAA